MTLALMKSFGVKSTWVNETIVVQNQKYKVNGTFAIELDWSAASYFYSLVALSPIGFTLYLNGLKMNSVQGDSVCVQLFEKLGVETEETPMGLRIEKTQSPQKSRDTFKKVDAEESDAFSKKEKKHIYYMFSVT